jgi:surfactin synthase thioesterase subunit
MTLAVTVLCSAGLAGTQNHRYLFLPPAGATLALLRNIVDAAPGVEVWGVEYPGREARIVDPLPSTLAELVEQVGQELAETCGPRGVARLVLVGFSMGAFVALELAWRMHALSGAAPAALVVVGAVAPHRRVPGRYTRTDDDTLTRLLDRDGLAPGLRESQETWDYVLELLRGDLRLVSRYQGPVFTRVPCPVAAFRGADDPGLAFVDDATGAWRSWTDGAFTARVVPGGHLGLLAAGRGAEFWALMREVEETITGGPR